MKSINMDDATAFWRLIKQRFSAKSSTFIAFHQALEGFTNQMMDFTSFSSKVEELFKGHNELILRFHEFLPAEDTANSKKVGVASHMKQVRKKRLWEIKDYNTKKSACREFLDRVERNLNDDRKFRLFIESLIQYKVHNDVNFLDREVSSLFKENPEFYVEFTNFTADSIEENAINEDNRDQKKSTDKKKIQKSPHELAMFECEDAMYIADMYFYGLESTKEAAESLLKKARNPNEEIDIEKFYTPSNLKFIRYMYDDDSDNNCKSYSTSFGEKMIELLYEDPVSATSVLVFRLDQKVKEAREWRQEIKKPWAQRLKIYSEKARFYMPPVKKQKTISPEPATTTEADDELLSGLKWGF